MRQGVRRHDCAFRAGFGGAQQPGTLLAAPTGHREGRCAHAAGGEDPSEARAIPSEPVAVLRLCRRFPDRGARGAGCPGVEEPFQLADSGLFASRPGAAAAGRGRVSRARQGRRTGPVAVLVRTGRSCRIRGSLRRGRPNLRAGCRHGPGGQGARAGRRQAGRPGPGAPGKRPGAPGCCGSRPGACAERGRGEDSIPGRAGVCRSRPGGQGAGAHCTIGQGAPRRAAGLCQAARRRDALERRTARAGDQSVHRSQRAPRHMDWTF